MKKLLVLALIAVAVGLSSCAGGLTKDQLSQAVQAIRDGVANACAFQPEVAGVTILVNTLYPDSASYTALVQAGINAICGAPTTQAAAGTGFRVQKLVRAGGKTIAVKGTILR